MLNKKTTQYYKAYNGTVNKSKLEGLEKDFTEKEWLLAIGKRCD